MNGTFLNSVIVVENVYDFFFGVEQEPKIIEIEIKHFIR